MKRLSLIALALALGACTPVAPTPPPAPPGNTTVTVIVNAGNGAQPSPAPGGDPSAAPFRTTLTQFGETCEPRADGTRASPSGADRQVRISCDKQLTCSPKCRLSNGSTIDCPVPAGSSAEFRVTSGQDRVSLRASPSNAGFNVDARGLQEGLALIECTYAGQKSEPFDLLVVP